VFLKVAEDKMRTQYELKKKERSSMLANMSLEQHAFSYSQKSQFKIPELPTASGNIREKMGSNKETATSSPHTPAKSLPPKTTTTSTHHRATPQGTDDVRTRQDNDDRGGAGPSAAAGRDDESEDTESCFETTVQESSKRKRKWFGLF
jgi:cell wall-associated NlpC family hydrolase